ncbi:MAG: hypothetical protein MK106_12570 [Mariniblastus sp.]|nr:hypothetical protein [Mariniblastus sp.]
MRQGNEKTKGKIILQRALFTCLFGAVILCGLLVINLGWKVYRWDVSIWAYHYLTAENPDSMIPDSEKHLIFVMVDHYEHGGPKNKKRGARENDIWCDKFMEISDRHIDDFGNRFRYTWFYPYDHKNDEIMVRLSKMAYLGYGETELHWHLGSKSGVNRQNFSVKLDEAIEWYQSYGALITAEDSKTAFAYIAGVWDLDAGGGGVTTHGITNQIQQLVDRGCYADFTFSTIGTPAQPSTVNSLYYVVDDPKEPKSYDAGEHARVGHAVDQQLLIFQGPTAISWNGYLEYGAIEDDPIFEDHRINKWIDSNIHVHGRPEWIFVKVYSHGAQSQHVVLDQDMDKMLSALRQETKQRDIKLHFMTAREAFNVIKSAEDGKQGNPEDYRDYRIGKYRNMVETYDST